MQNARGFTVVELIIVILVLGILATIVMVSFTGFFPRQRDSERQTETETIARYLEDTFQKEGQYPTVAVMSGSVSGVQTAIGNISPNVLAAPTVAAGTNSLTGYSVGSPPTATQYGYWTPNSASCIASYTVTDCATFVLAYKKDVGGAVIAICGRGPNVNNAKTIFAGANGLTSFASTSCSNF